MRRFNWGIWTNPVALPAAAFAATSPDSTASVRSARAAAGSQPVAKGRLRAAAVRPRVPRRRPRRGFQVGQQLRVDLFAQVKAVDITGISKGRGTAGRDEAAPFLTASGPATA